MAVIGDDAWASRILLEEMGLRVVAQWSGDSTIAETLDRQRGILGLLSVETYFPYRHH